MGRLIDAGGIESGKVIKAILNKDNFPVVEETNICDLPTAYDVDEVVEQLEDLCFSPVAYAGYAVDLELAIKIVKAGGVDAVN